MTIQPELMTRVLAVSRAIDNVLVANHTMRAALKRGHVPFGTFSPDGQWEPTPIAEGVARYGEGPLFGLWLECRAVEALRVAWTGKAGTPVEALPEEPDEAQGLAPAAPEPVDEGTENQQRLTEA